MLPSVVVAAITKEFGLSMATIADDDELDWWIYGTTWILVTRDKAFLAQEEIHEAADDPPKKPRLVLWTDDHASLYEILK